jgi:hypothetical protein
LVRGTPESAAAARKHGVQSTVTRTTIVHRFLWQKIVLPQLEAARTAEKEAAVHFRLVAMVFMSHVLEGYINFAGMRLCPAIWKHEKKLSFDERLEKVAFTCGFAKAAAVASNTEWASITHLKDLRDAIAHPKVESKDTKKFHRSLNIQFDALPYQHGQVTKIWAQRCAKDLRSYIEAINHKARAIESEVQAQDLGRTWFGDHPLDGPIDFTSPRSWKLNEPRAE